MQTILGVLAIIAVLLLQMYLSQTRWRWPGLILPALTLVISLVRPIQALTVPSGAEGVSIGAVLAGMLIGNIPTAILLVMYFTGRRNRPIRDEEINGKQKQ